MKIIVFFGLMLVYSIVTCSVFALSNSDLAKKSLMSFAISFILTCVIGIVIGMSLLIDA